MGPALSIFPTSVTNPSAQAKLPEGVSDEPTGSGMSWAAVWFDANGDGWEDLYVAMILASPHSTKTIVMGRLSW